MKAAVQELTDGLNKITEMYKEEPYLLSITEFFKEHKDFSKTAVYALQMQAAYKKEQEAKAAAQSNTLQNAPQDAAAVSNDITAPTTSNAVPVNPEAKQPVFKGRFEVEATKEQLNALGAFMKSNGIKFTVIK